MDFNNFTLSAELIEALQRNGIKEPMPIQRQVVPAALAGRNLLVTSQTGSGKTVAYLAPTIERLGAASHSMRALILAPTRELAQQIGAVATPLAQAVGLRTAIVVGGVEYALQREALAQQPEIVVATPGRLIDLLEQDPSLLEGVDIFILDEVDQMLDLGFRDPIEKLSKLRHADAQSLCFSATLPAAVVEIVGEIAPNVEQVRAEGATLSVENIEQLGYYVSFEMMDRLLIHLLRSEAPQQSIIFTRSRKMADRIAKLLAENSITAEAMHSDRSQAAREHILGRFRAGETSTIVATDVIARGIDIDSVSHVFNFGLPQSPEQYIHRCGRCGRVGRAGRALSLFTPDEKPQLDAICRLMKRHIIIDNAHPYLTSEVTKALYKLGVRS